MPSELQRVALALVECLDQVPQMVEYLQRLAQRCRDNAGYIADISNHPAARNAALELDMAARCCDDAAHLLSLTPLQAGAWAMEMVGGGRSAGVPSTSKAVGPNDRSAGRTPSAERRPEDDQAELEPARPPKISDEDAWRLFRKLPIRVEKFGHREKTKGIWRDDDGMEHDLISGQGDDLYRHAEEFAIRQRLGNPPGTLSITSHVEIKFAMLMQERGLTNAAIVINKVTCKGDSSCDQWLAHFLPPGAKLTVYGPNNFKETYPKEPPIGGS